MLFSVIELNNFGEMEIRHNLWPYLQGCKVIYNTVGVIKTKSLHVPNDIF
jgi:hypothetical protein